MIAASVGLSAALSLPTLVYLYRRTAAVGVPPHAAGVLGVWEGYGVNAASGEIETRLELKCNKYGVCAYDGPRGTMRGVATFSGEGEPPALSIEETGWGTLLGGVGDTPPATLAFGVAAWPARGDERMEVVDGGSSTEVLRRVR